MWACSDFVAESCLRDRDLLSWLASQGRLLEAATSDWLAADFATGGGSATAADDAAFMDAMRRFRRRQLVRIAWRDLASLADVETVLRELSLLADVCIAAACDDATRALLERYGVPRGQDGSELGLMVLGMGKLGGGELNFSSDIDLVFLYPEHGETDGGGRSSTRSTSRASAGAWSSCSAPSRPRASSTAWTCGCGRSATRDRRS